MTPRAYRLSMQSMAVIMDKYANQLAEQYGAETVADMFRQRQREANETESKYEYERFKNPSEGSDSSAPEARVKRL